MKVTESIKEKLVHYVKTHDEQKTARLVSWILVAAMSIAFLGILSCAVIRPKADNNVTRNTGAGGTTIQREYPNPADYGYDPTTALIDENGKAYVWIGEDQYARSDTYGLYINDPIWRRHFVNDHPTGYKTVFKWDCPTCLNNLLSEQNIITNTETELTYTGINMAMKKLYTDMSFAYGNSITDPPQVNDLFQFVKDTIYSGSASDAGFVAGTTQGNAIISACLNFSATTGLKFLYLCAIPTNNTDTSFRLCAIYKNPTDTYTTTITTRDGKNYIVANGSINGLVFAFNNNELSFRSTCVINQVEVEMASVTTNTLVCQNQRLIYFNPNQDDTIRWYQGSTLPNTPSVLTVYNPLNTAQLAGNKVEKTVTTNILTNLYDGSNQVLKYKWSAVRMVNNYSVISTGGNVTDEDIAGWQAEGRQQVINSPNTYNLYTVEQYNAMRTTGRNDVINSPHTYNLYTAAEYTAHGQAEYQRGYANAAGTPSSQDWKISTVVKAVPEGMYTFYQNIVEPIQDPTEELLGVNVGALVAVVAVIGLVVIGIAIVKKVF